MNRIILWQLTEIRPSIPPDGPTHILLFGAVVVTQPGLAMGHSFNDCRH
jgi:hypothetical protein